MISWGVQVNDFGNAILDAEGNFIKESDKGVDEAVWRQMLIYARDHGLTGGNFKKLNAPFENRLLAQSGEIRDRDGPGGPGICLYAAHGCVQCYRYRRYRFVPYSGNPVP